MMDRILMYISFLIVMLFYKSESICDKKSRGSDKSCSKYGTCDECIACDSYCSWCHVGGMCTKFCEGEDGAACKSPDCAKKSEFICASMGESHMSSFYIYICKEKKYLYLPFPEHSTNCLCDCFHHRSFFFFFVFFLFFVLKI